MPTLRICLVFGVVAASAVAVGQPAATLPAQPGERVALLDALAVAVRQNPTLAARGIDIDVAEARALQVRGIDDFILDARANWVSLRTDPIAGNPFQQLERDALNLGAGLTKPLST